MIQTTLLRTAAAIALGASCAVASAALPPFTFTPVAAGLAGASFTADNILISDYSTVSLSGATFSESGFLAVSGYQLGGSTFTPAGLNSTYGVYISFSGSGSVTAADPASVPTFGSFSSLTYTLYGYNGTASFDFAGNTPTVTGGTGLVALASGSLLSGSVVTVPAGSGSFVPSANASLAFAVNPAEAGFFASPGSFYNVAQTAFTNTTSTVEPFAGGFRIREGGGSINFASAVPEPETYALMLAGLGALGFAARRRKAA